MDAVKKFTRDEVTTEGFYFSHVLMQREMVRLIGHQDLIGQRRAICSLSMLEVG